MVLIGGVSCYPMGEEHVVDERGFGDNVRWERICSNNVEGSGGCYSSMRFGEMMMDQPS
jgi:hypothetical protein